MDATVILGGGRGGQEELDRSRDTLWLRLPKLLEADLRRHSCMSRVKKRSTITIKVSVDAGIKRLGDG